MDIHNEAKEQMKSLGLVRVIFHKMPWKILAYFEVLMQRHKVSSIRCGMKFDLLDWGNSPHVAQTWALKVLLDSAETLGVLKNLSEQKALRKCVTTPKERGKHPSSQMGAPWGLRDGVRMSLPRTPRGRTIA